MVKIGLAVIFLLAIKCPASLYYELSSLEKSVVDEALALFGRIPVDDAEGKRIKDIFIFTAPPFTKEAGILHAFNHIHVNTKDFIIRRDMSAEPGDIFDSSVIEDNERVLRKRSQVRSIVVIIPVRAKTGPRSEVDLLVATKDLLSLGVSFNFAGSASNITNFMVSLAEHNLLGFNKSMSAAYEMQQGTHIFSGSYFDPSLFGSSLQMSINESLLFLRQGFGYDGLLSDIRLAKPLLVQTDTWGYGLSFKWGAKTVFDFQGGNLRTFEIVTDAGKKTVDRTYRYRYGAGSLYGIYSLGTAYKKEFSFGYGFNLKNPSILVKDLTPEETAIYQNKILPVDEFESFINLGFSYFQNHFLTLYDYNNFRVEETVRIGPQLSISADFASMPLFLSDHNFIRPKLSLAYTQSLGSDAFLNVSASSSNRLENSFTDNTYRTSFSAVSPKIYVGRIILSGGLAQTFDNRDNQKFILGSDSGLRGVESRFYSGTKGLSFNTEIRSVPLDLWIIHAGLVAFYDVGSAFDSWSKVNATQAVGLGVRVLAPQVSSLPFRIDVAFPLSGPGKNYHTVVPSFGVGQAF